MGRKTDVLLRGFRAAKCLTFLKLATSRIKVLRNKRSVSAKQMRGDIAHLLKTGQDAQVYITKADALIKQENMVAVYDLIDQYCHSIISRFPTIEMQSNCPIDMKGPIATLIFAAPRCVEISELASIKVAFTAKYGKEFAAAALELRPDCGVNKQVIELLSTRPATGDMKLKIMKEISMEYKVNWSPGEALAEPTTNTPAGSSQQSAKANNVEAIKVTGNVGSTKTPLEPASLKVSEAGPSTLQGSSKHEEINKTGVATMEALKHHVLASDASKSSSVKQDVGTATASVLQSVEGTSSTGNSSAKFVLAAAVPLKTGDGAVFAANAFKTNDTKEGGMGSANSSTVESLKGEIDTGTSCAGSGSFKESKGKPGGEAGVHVQPVVDNQDGLSDSDNDSFASVEEGDDIDVSLIGETQESSSTIESPPEDSSMQSSFAMESLQEDPSLNASRKNSLNTGASPEQKSFRAESRKSSLKEEKSSSLTVVSSHEDVFLRANSKNQMSILGEKQQLEEEQQSFEGSIKEGVQRNNIVEDTSFVAIAESPIVEKLVEMNKVESFSDRVSAEEVSPGSGKDVPKEVSTGCGEDVPGKGASLNINESVSKQINVVPSTEKGVQELNGTSFQGALAPPGHSQDFDFAAAAKAIAAEAARLAVLDYAKRIAGSSSIPVDLTDLSNFGLDFEGNLKVSQVTEKLNSEGKSEMVDSQDVRHGGKSNNDVIKEQASKVEVALDDDVGINNDHAKIVEMSHIGDANVEKSMHSVADSNDTKVNTMGHSWTEDEALQQQDMASENDDINPFAMGVDKATNSLLSKTGEDDNSSWVTKTNPKLVGGFGQEEDHLDVFFKRKTPIFDEDRYSFVDVKSSFLKERPPYFGYDKKESILKDKVVATATVFDNLPAESQSTFFEESSSSSKKESVVQDKVVSAPVFDTMPESQSTLFDESSGSFKIPVFDDEGLEAYDTAFSFDDGSDRTGLIDKKGPPSSPSIKASPHFDLEPEPSFDREVDEEEKSSMEKRVSGQLKWQSKKPISGETLAPYASIGLASTPMSRRSRKPSQRVEEHEYGNESQTPSKLYTDGLTSKRPQVSSSTPTQQQGRKDKYDVIDKGTLRSNSTESLAYSSDAMSKRPSGSPKWVSNQDEHGQSNKGNFTSTSVEDHFPSSRTTKSPIRSSRRQNATLEERDEDFYFDEEIGSTSTGSGVSRRTTKSPTKAANRQQQLPQVYDDHHHHHHDSEGYTFSNKPLRIPKFSKQDLVEDDDSIVEEPVPRYKPYRQSDDLGKGTSSSSVMYGKKPPQQQEYSEYEPAHMQSAQVNSVGKSNPTGQLSGGRKQWDVEEEEDLTLRYLPSARVDNVGKHSSSRPLLSKEKYEEDDLYLAPRYKLSTQLDDLGRASSGPPSGRRQQVQRPQEKEQEEHEQEEFYSMPLPTNWRQGERLKENERMSRPSYGRKQDVRLGTEDLGSSIEYDQQQEEQWHHSMLSVQEKQRRRLPPYGQEKQRRPSPPLQKYEEEFQSMPLPDQRQEEGHKRKQPPYGWKQSSRLEKEKSDLSQKVYEWQQEQQWHPSMLPEEAQDGEGKQHQRLPHYGVEKQRRPMRVYEQYKQEEEEEEFHSMRLPDQHQEELRKEKEHMPRPLYAWKQDLKLEKETSNLLIEDYEQQQEEQQRPSMLSKQDQDKLHWLSPPHRPDSELQNKVSNTKQKEEILQEQQWPSSDLRQKQSLVEEVAEKKQQGREKERLPSPVYERQQDVQEEMKSSELSMEHKLQKEEQLHQTTALPEGKKVQDGQGDENRPWPLYRRKESKLEKEKSLAKDGGVKGVQEKAEIKAQPPARQSPSVVPAQSASPPIESSISDPIILATIPPPVKKPVVRPVPAATTLESAGSAPPFSVPEVKLPKVPQKPPNVEELLANFEALRKARKGE